MRKLFILILFILTACAPSPIDEAKANQIRQETSSDAFDRAQARQNAQVLFEINVPVEEAKAARLLEQEIWMRQVTPWVVGSITVGMCVALLAVSGSASYVAVETGRAAAVYAKARAELMAGVIYLDPKTKTFPAIRHIHNGRWLMTYPDGEVVRLDESKPADKLKITAMAGVQMANVQYSETGKARNSQRMDQIQTPIMSPETIEASFEKT